MKSLNKDMKLFIDRMSSFVIAFQTNEKVEVSLETTDFLKIFSNEKIIWLNRINNITANDIREHVNFTLLFTENEKHYLRIFGNIKQINSLNYEWEVLSKCFSEVTQSTPIITFDILNIEFINSMD